MINEISKCFVINVPQVVTVRKYEVDIESLKTELRDCKKKSKLSCKDISIKLNKPKTLVEHWFRNDKCFAIPDADIWFDLKDLIHIETDKFDKSIITFEKRFGVYEKSERCYLDYGIAPTVTCSDEIKIIETK